MKVWSCLSWKVLKKQCCLIKGSFSDFLIWKVCLKFFGSWAARTLTIVSRHFRLRPYFQRSATVNHSTSKMSCRHLKSLFHIDVSWMVHNMNLSQNFVNIFLTFQKTFWMLPRLLKTSSTVAKHLFYFWSFQKFSSNWGVPGDSTNLGFDCTVLRKH